MRIIINPGWNVFIADGPFRERATSRYDWIASYTEGTNHWRFWYLCHERGTDRWWVSPGCVSDEEYHMDRGPFTREEAEALILTLTQLRYEERRTQEGSA